MKIVGLITEYNPFHNGHKHHIEMSKSITGADIVIAVMSGNYVQRGAPALIPKHLRCLAALQNGADLVLELPSIYALGSAELFAFGAVSLLDSLGCVDSICFGSECGKIEPLKQISDILVHEPALYKTCLASHLKSGVSFPSAREQALRTCLGETFSEHLLSSSNNILAIEYLKALSRKKSPIVPYTIQRLGSAYREESLEGMFSSATSIRNYFKELSLSSSEIFSMLSTYIPNNCLSFMESNYQIRYPVFEEDFSLLLKYRLLEEDTQSLQKYLDVSTDIANRIMRCTPEFISFSQFCRILKTKEITYSRICRILFHIILKITKEEAKETETLSHHFVRILGFRKEKKEVFRTLKLHCSLPLLTRLSAYRSLPPMAADKAALEIKRDAIYESVITEKFHSPYHNPITQQIIVL